MLLYFKARNFLSFNEEISFSTVAGNYKIKNPKSNERENELQENLIPLDNYKVNALSKSVIYGANASGKSNLLSAMGYARIFILQNFIESNSADHLKNFFYDYFNRNNQSNLEKPISVTFGVLVNGIQFEYSFSLDSNRIISETLLEYKTQKPIEHFHRLFNVNTNDYEWSFSKYFSGQKDAVRNITNQFALYLTVGSVSKLPICEKVFQWFFNSFIVSIDFKNPGAITDEFTLTEMHKSPEVKKFVLEQLKIADFNIIDIQIRFEDGKIVASSIHKAVDKDNKETTVTFDYFTQESIGTRRFVGWLGTIMSIISNDRVLLIDEFGVSMHSLLTKHLLHAINWQSPITGKKSNAQLIFTTHDTNLLTRELFRPDQIWIMEKDGIGNSNLYSLSQFKALKGLNLESGYLQGLYGGIPHFKNKDNE